MSTGFHNNHDTFDDDDLIARSDTLAAEAKAASLWTVWRQGRPSVPLKCVYTGAEADARRIFKDMYVAVRQGVLLLRDDTGAQVKQYVAPMVRSAW